jgi:hypothetical protein
VTTATLPSRLDALRCNTMRVVPFVIGQAAAMTCSPYRCRVSSTWSTLSPGQRHLDPGDADGREVFEAGEVGRGVEGVGRRVATGRVGELDVDCRWVASGPVGAPM